MHLVASYNEVPETDKSGFDKLLLTKCFVRTTAFTILLVCLCQWILLAAHLSRVDFRAKRVAVAGVAKRSSAITTSICCKSKQSQNNFFF
jgi:hypothetical protein